MKIGIVTFNSAHNYGAVLQAWALQEYLRGEGHDPSIINYRINDIDKLYRIYKPRNPYKNQALNGLVHRAQDVKAYFRDKNKYKKYRKFEHFINHTLNTTKAVTTYQQLLKQEYDFDVLISGSDQVWNGSFTKMNPAYFLNFGTPEMKRISYAASIGKDEIADNEALQFQKYIKNFDYISVREEKAKEQVLRFIDDDVEVVVDPTLLLSRDKYDEIKIDPKINQEYIYVHNVHLVKVDERLNAMAEELSKRTGLPIVHNRPDYSFTNEAGKFLDGGPEEFIGWIANARYVIANSFHATVFSMIYHKEFITIPHFQNPDRMRFFLGSLGIGNHLIDVPENLPADLKDLAIDYDSVEEKRHKMRERSVAFLKRALAGEKRTGEFSVRKTYFDFKDPYKCYGCRACEEVCPTGAITMEADNHGFIYPVVNEEKCIYCDKCEKVCIYDNKAPFNQPGEFETKVYGANNKDNELRLESASGGVFTSLYEQVIKKGGYVVGVKLDENQQGVYAIENTVEGCKAFSKVKYVTAGSESLKGRVKELLDANKLVLFSGVACDVAALKSYLGKEYSNLITVDMLCGGMASPRVYDEYKAFLEEKYNSKITNITFESKFRGKTKAYFIVEFESGEIHLEEARKNNYMNAYNNSNIQRPICYNCEFMKGTDSVSDITLGRFKRVSVYSPELDDIYGTSFVIINTKKGDQLFDSVKETMETREVDMEKLPSYYVKKPLPLTLRRSQLMNQLGEKDINSLLYSFNTTRKRKKKRK